VKKHAAWLSPSREADRHQQSRRTVVSLRARAQKASDLILPRRQNEVDGIDDVVCAPCRPGRRRRQADAASRRTRTLLSFQGPMPGRWTTKRPPLTQEASDSTGYERGRIRIERRGSRSRRAFIASLSGGRGSVARAFGVSRSAALRCVMKASFLACEASQARTLRAPLLGGIRADRGRRTCAARRTPGTWRALRLKRH
jgi:hypothetical protein